MTIKLYSILSLSFFLFLVGNVNSQEIKRGFLLEPNWIGKYDGSDKFKLPFRVRVDSRSPFFLNLYSAGNSAADRRLFVAEIICKNRSIQLGARAFDAESYMTLCNGLEQLVVMCDLSEALDKLKAMRETIPIVCVCYLYTFDIKTGKFFVSSSISSPLLSLEWSDGAFSGVSVDPSDMLKGQEKSGFSLDHKMEFPSESFLRK